MSNQYEHYTDITREVLNKVNVGDLIKINDWKRPLRVKAVSQNYFVMSTNLFGKQYYSVCSKIPWDGIRHNNMVGGMFHCGTDNWIFGSPLSKEYDDLYEFNNEEANRRYLQEFENGVNQISHRSGAAIYDLYIKTSK